MGIVSGIGASLTPAVPTSLLRASPAENAVIWSVDSPALLTASRPNAPGRRFL